jgi:hypothetical protein
MLRLQSLVESSSWWPHAVDPLQPTVHPALFARVLSSEFEVDEVDALSVCEYFSMCEAAEPVVPELYPAGFTPPEEWTKPRWSMYPPMEGDKGWVLENVRRERLRHIERTGRSHLDFAELSRPIREGDEVEVEEPLGSYKWLRARVADVSETKPTLYTMTPNDPPWWGGPAWSYDIDAEGDERLVSLRPFVEWLRGALASRRAAIVAAAWRFALQTGERRGRGGSHSGGAGAAESPLLDDLTNALVVEPETRDADLAAFRALWGRSFDFDRVLDAPADSACLRSRREGEDAAARFGHRAALDGETRRVLYSEFVAFYRDVGGAIAADDGFVARVRADWGLPPPPDVAPPPASHSTPMPRRVSTFAAQSAGAGEGEGEGEAKAEGAHLLEQRRARGAPPPTRFSAQAVADALDEEDRERWGRR